MNESELKNMNQVFDEVKEETAEDWVNEFNEQELEEREEEERWFSQFLQPDGDAWANEFARNTTTKRPIKTTGEAWVDEYVNGSTDDWVSDFSRFQEEHPRSISELTEKISKIDDPKLQSSKFMEFIKQIDSGEVTFEDLQNRPV